MTHGDVLLDDVPARPAPAAPAAGALPPGLVILHGNRLEDLRDAVFAWMARQPLAPLEPELVLVQSNGAAEWFKIALAQARGLCAAVQVELPARFLWRAYRQVLSPVLGALPAQSPLDKAALTWRLMRLLPALVDDPVYAPLQGYLAGDGAEPDEATPTRSASAAPASARRRLQLAARLADLFDQYQVYRADWLADWADRHDRLRGPAGLAELPADQRWQPALWRALLDDVVAHAQAPGDDEAPVAHGLPADPAGALAATRPAVHRRFLQRLDDLAAGLVRREGGNPSHAGDDGAAPAPALPRRLIVFGTAHLPAQTLEALVALSRHAQVLVAVPNPCRWHWAEIIDQRELLRSAARPPRHGLRKGTDLAAVPLASMHLHAHPLLAAWGRQGRDFMRLLDAVDEGMAGLQGEAFRRAAHDGSLPRIELFDDADPADPALSLLAQVQAAIRELLPLAEHPRRRVAADDRSIVFHTAHSAQREVEVLHDQLLALLASPPPPGARALEPRDIVVMVPDIELFEPAIRAVFGQIERHDPRFIPFEIADLRPRGQQPLVRAVEWLMQAPTRRFRLSELQDLLEVPALARRFGLDAPGRERLVAWMAGAGIRWGLDATQREQLGLGACGTQNSARFGLDRLLLGYLSGPVGPWMTVDASDPADPAAIDDERADHQDGAAAASAFDPSEPQVPRLDSLWPHDEVGGLDAAVVGALADLLDRLQAWWRSSLEAATPSAWAARLRRLLDELFEPGDERERLALAALDAALSGWLAACETAAFDAPVPVDLAREAWFEQLDAPGSGRRFLAGGVTFCTLMPLRSVPFEVVCLLGMNEGDYPRATRRSDFDLLGLPGQARPGDRSRRDDDRYLLLEALLSARRQLHVSWVGRSARDLGEQPPSVLIGQLRDYLAAGWRPADAVGEPTPGEPPDPAEARRLLAQLDTAHPLQPFSPRYFDARGVHPQLFTYAADWREAHADGASGAVGAGGAEGAEGAMGAVDAKGTEGSVDGESTQGADARATGGIHPAAALPAFAGHDTPLTLTELTRFLKNPVKAFFRTRLDVRFDDIEPDRADDEMFAADALEDWQLLDRLLAQVGGDRRTAPPDEGHASAGAWAPPGNTIDVVAPAGGRAQGQAQSHVRGRAQAFAQDFTQDLPEGLAHPVREALQDSALEARIDAELARLRGSGLLPMAHLGEHFAADLRARALPLLQAEQAWLQRYPVPAGQRRVQHRFALVDGDDSVALLLDDWLTGLRRAAEAHDSPLVVVQRQTSALSRPADNDAKPPTIKPHRLVETWLQHLVEVAFEAPADAAPTRAVDGAPAPGGPTGGDAGTPGAMPPTAIVRVLIGPDGAVISTAPPPEVARASLQAVAEAWTVGLRAPLPLPLKTALAEAAGKDPTSVYEGGGDGQPGEGADAHLARCFEDFDALAEDGRFEAWAKRLYEPLLAWLDSAAVRFVPMAGMAQAVAAGVVAGVTVHAGEDVGAGDIAAAPAANDRPPTKAKGRSKATPRAASPPRTGTAEDGHG